MFLKVKGRLVYMYLCEMSNMFCMLGRSPGGRKSRGGEVPGPSQNLE